KSERKRELKRYRINQRISSKIEWCVWQRQCECIEGHMQLCNSSALDSTWLARPRQNSVSVRESFRLLISTESAWCTELCLFTTLRQMPTECHHMHSHHLQIWTSTRFACHKL